MTESPNAGSSQGLGDENHLIRPFEGQSIVITRPREQAEVLQLELERLGATAIVHPVIRILPPLDFEEMDRCIEQLDAIDWLVFVSVNAVRFFIDRLSVRLGSTSKLQEKKIAVIGKATANVLEQVDRVTVDLISPIANSRSLGTALGESAQGERLLILRADRRTPQLSELLDSAGINYEQLTAYRSCDVDRADPEVAKRMDASEIDWVTITSSAIARSAMNAFGVSLRNTRLASISPATSLVLREHGFEPAAEATVYDMPGLIQAMVAHDAKRDS